MHENRYFVVSVNILNFVVSVNILTPFACGPSFLGQHTTVCLDLPNN